VAAPTTRSFYGPTAKGGSEIEQICYDLDTGLITQITDLQGAGRPGGCADAVAAADNALLDQRRMAAPSPAPEPVYTTSHLPQRLPQRATVSSSTLIPTISQWLEQPLHSNARVL
jgi:hypothetical protein